MSEVKNAVISPEIIESAYSYKTYRAMLDELMSEGKTTGENHSEAMIHYTKMNIHRMKRLDKRTKINEDLVERLEQVERPMIWLVLTEAWCGDAAQIVPVIQKMADYSKSIEVKLILRDEHLEVMDQFLTNGKSRSIPKLICLDAETLDVLGDWGPRPQDAQILYDSLRNTDGLAYQDVAEKLHKWYADDKTQSIQNEILPLVKEWEKQ